MRLSQTLLKVLTALIMAGSAIVMNGQGLAADDDAPGVPLASWTNPSLGADWLTVELARELFPDVTDVDPEANPRVAPVYADGTLQGYVFATRDITDSLGFSSLEFVIAVGLRLDGRMLSRRVTGWSSAAGGE